MFDYKEIERTIKDNHLPFQEIGDVNKEILIQRLYDTFVIGNPRALWLKFKYVPYSIDCNMEDPYFHLLDIIDKNIVFYFLLIIGTGILSFIKQECLIYIYLSATVRGLTNITW